MRILLCSLMQAADLVSVILSALFRCFEFGKVNFEIEVITTSTPPLHHLHYTHTPPQP